MSGKMGKTAVARQGKGLGDYFPVWLQETFFGRPTARQMTLEDALAKGKGGRRRVVDIVLPQSFLLRRILANPPQSRRNWAAFARLDLMRQTPFSVDQVKWSLTETRKGDARELTQWIAKTSEINSVTTRLEERGLTPRQFLFRADGTLHVLTKGQTGGRRWLAALNAALLLLPLGALTAAWLMPAWSASTQADALTPQLQDLRADTVELRRELEEIRLIDAERTAFLDSLARDPRAITLLRDTTVHLPDTVWLNEWNYTRGDLRLVGEINGSAADLVLDLSQTARDWSPALTGAVSRTPDGNERFDMAVTTARGAL